MNARFAIAAAILLPLLESLPAAGALSDCIDATCRITAPDGGRGTGCVFERSQGAVYVLTAAHVANDRAVKCEFWQQGHQSALLPGETVLRVLNDTTDAAVIAVPEAAFAGRFPPIVPIAPRGYAIEAGQTLTSVGCAGGAWATGWKGHVLGYDGTDMYFVPAPAQGRSGSALFDEGGEQIVGIVRARTLDNEQGIATGIQALYGQLCRAAAEREAQCGPNGCPAPGYRLLPYQQPQQGGQQGRGRQYLLPYRQQQEDRWRQQQGQGQPNLNPWPTLPGQPPKSETPVIPMAPVPATPPAVQSPGPEPATSSSAAKAETPTSAAGAAGILGLIATGLGYTSLPSLALGIGAWLMSRRRTSDRIRDDPLFPKSPSPAGNHVPPNLGSIEGKLETLIGLVSRLHPSASVPAQGGGGQSPFAPA